MLAWCGVFCIVYLYSHLGSCFLLHFFCHSYLIFICSNYICCVVEYHIIVPLCFKLFISKFCLNYIVSDYFLMPDPSILSLHDARNIFIIFRIGQSLCCSPSSSTYIWLSAWHNRSCNFYCCVPVSSYYWYFVLISLGP